MSDEVSREINVLTINSSGGGHFSRLSKYNKKTELSL